MIAETTLYFLIGTLYGLACLILMLMLNRMHVEIRILNRRVKKQGRRIRGLTRFIRKDHSKFDFIKQKPTD